MKRDRKIIITTAIITTLVVVFCLTTFYLSPLGIRVFSSLSNDEGVKNFSKFVQVDGLIERDFMGEYSSEQLMDNALESYVATLGDPYTNYLNKENFESMNESLDGGYKGIGVTVNARDGKIVIAKVQKNSPAQKAGIQKDDILLKVDMQSYSAENVNAAISRIKSTPVGKTVTLTVQRGEAILDIPLKIEEIKMEYVTSKMLDSSIGYIRLKTFGKDIADSFKKQADKLKSDGMKGLIIDLRSNPGGSLDSVVEIADYLLGEGTIISVRTKDGEEEVYKSDKKELGLPMCVLINENSASASEVLSGALRDYNKATLIGKKTYGKGVVQAVYDLGDKTGLSLTIAKYYTPSGECIHGTGIAPHIEASLPEGITITQNDDEIENDTQLEAAIRQMRTMIK